MANEEESNDHWPKSGQGTPELFIEIFIKPTSCKLLKRT